MKKLITLIISVSAVFTATTAFAATAVTGPSGWAKEAVTSAISEGLVPTRLQSKYQSPITRDEFAELLVQTILAKTNKDDGSDVSWTIDSFLERVTVDVNFEDTDSDYIKVAFAIGAINGVSDTMFSPNSQITRQEAATMLINTVHYSSGTIYAQEGLKKIYSDYSKIAKWAQPAVENSYYLNLMEGANGSFDYKGKFTREQAITTMKRIFDEANYSILTLKGVATIRPYFTNTHFSVGKDYVNVDYADDKYWETYGDDMYVYVEERWNEFNNSNVYGEMPSLDAGMTSYLFSSLQTDMPEVIKAAVDNKSISVDFGYMTYTTLTKEHVIEMKLKPVSGYMTILAGYTYGYPKKEVTPKVIK
ncbi:S-layer homology domain-containing protein [Cohnella lupini]|uniref:S-layer family protein n=1 Tax=Cohnella lupini TaxID=1294267 RepID=A0A3D9INB8_9BACL|nr:S-layer homology domain-containing protein [Cohnella lupini]RED63009.1 S-layer family protein [Cohnella lupini]